MNADVTTPCIGHCHLHITGICEGCGRTLIELDHWSRMTELQRKAVMALIPARARKFNVTLLNTRGAQ